MITSSPSTKPEQLSFNAADGYRLTALKYRACGEMKGHLIVAGATGVHQRFYRRFAEYASEQGFTTLTLDYRGIGLSKPGTLKGFRMDYLDWAYQDLAAAVDAMASDSIPLFMVGHSFGGHAFGLLPNHDRVVRFYTFGTGAGWHGWMPPLERLRVLALWRIAGPVMTWWKGYLAWSKLGMGEDLPLGVYRQWRHWCRFPRYFFDDPAMTHVAERFAQVRTPIIAANALDDLWASARSREAFMTGYSQTRWQAIDIDPQKVGMDDIGHMGYFQAGAQPLWQDVLDWFKAHPNSPALPTKIHHQVA